MGQVILKGPQGQILLPSMWESVVQPGLQVSLQFRHEDIMEVEQMVERVKAQADKARAQHTGGKKIKSDDEMSFSTQTDKKGHWWNRVRNKF